MTFQFKIFNYYLKIIEKCDKCASFCATCKISYKNCLTCKSAAVNNRKNTFPDCECK